MAFDPDAYLRGLSSKEFDPDKYLSGLGLAEPATREVPTFLGVSAKEFAEAAVPESDILKRIVSSGIQGVAGAPAGAEAALRAPVRQVMGEGLLEQSELYQLGRRLFGREPTPEEIAETQARKIETDRTINESIPLIPGLQELAQGGRDVADFIRERQSPEALEAVRGSQMQGNLLEAITSGDYSKLSFGENPTLYGYALQGADVLGSLIPVIVSGAMGPVAAGTVGGSMAAGEAAQNAKDFVKSKSDVELAAASPYYKDLIAAGVPPEQARSIIADRAAEQAAFLQGSVATIGGVATQKLIAGAADNIISAAGRNRLMKIAVGGTLAGAEEGTQEFLEGIAADLGINKEVIKEIGEDSFANFVLGFIGGAPAGMARGALPDQQQPAQPGAPTTTPPAVQPPAAAPPAAQPSAAAAPTTPPTGQPPVTPVTPSAGILGGYTNPADQTETQIIPAPNGQFQVVMIDTATGQTQDGGTFGTFDEANNIAAQIAGVAPTVTNVTVPPAVTPPVTPTGVSVTPPTPPTPTPPAGTITPPTPPVIKPAGRPAKEIQTDINKARQELKRAETAFKNNKIGQEAVDVAAAKLNTFEAEKIALTTPPTLPPEVTVPEVEAVPELPAKGPKTVFEEKMFGKEPILSEEELTARKDISDKQRALNIQYNRIKGTKGFNNLADLLSGRAAQPAKIEGADRPLPDGMLKLDEDLKRVDFGVGRGATLRRNSFVSKTGRGKPLQQMIEDEQLNDFLPDDLKVFVRAEDVYDPNEFSKVRNAVDYIIERIENNDFLNEDDKMALRVIDENIEKLSKELTLGQINARLAEIAAEERTGEAETIAPPVPEEGARGVEEAPARAPEQRIDAASAMQKSIAPEEFKLTGETLAEGRERVKREEAEREAREKKQVADRERDLFALQPTEKAPRPEPKTASLFEDRPVSGTDEDLKSVQAVANKYGGEIAYFDPSRKLGLVRGYASLSGQPVYLMVLGNSHTLVDVDSVTNASFEPYKAEMSDLKKRLEQEAAQRHQDAPFITFRDGVSMSSGMDPKIAEITKQWKSLLGLDEVNIYFSTIDDAKENRNKFTGPHRVIGSGTLSPNETGSTRRMNDGSYYVLFDKSTSTTKVLETIAHEVGHIHEKEAYNNASPELKEKLKAAHNRWLQSRKGKTAREAVNMLRAKTTAQTTNVLNPEKRAEDLNPYWSSFSEWYADQVSRWAVTNEKPVSVVEKFFARLAAALRKFYQTLKGQNFLPDETFVEYLKQLNPKIVDLPKPEGPAQMDFAFQMLKTNVFGQPIPKGSWDAPTESKMDNVIYTLQDKLIDTKRVVENIRKSGKQIADRWDPYLAEELFHGRTAKQTQDFLKDELEPLINEIRAKGLTIEKLEEYLHNRHAESRNKFNAKRDPNMPDGGSGIMTADAKAYMAALTPQQKKDFDDLAKRVDAIVKGTQDVIVKTGQETQAVINAWNKAMEHYVPLQREEADYDIPKVGTGVGSGIAVKGPFSRAALGSSRNVVNILANLGAQRERAIVRGEKMRVQKALYGLVASNPNPGFWLAFDPEAMKDPVKVQAELSALGLNPNDIQNLIAEPVKRTLDPRTNTVVETPADLLKDSRFSVPIRINGKEKYVIFNSKDPRAMRMAEALQNLDVDSLGRVLAGVQQFTQYFAKINTQYNPIFGVINFVRDIQGAMIQVGTTPLAKDKTTIVANTLPALRGIYAEERNRRAGKPPLQNTWAQLWEEFQQEGGQTGFRDQFSRMQDRAEALQAILDPSSWTKSPLGKVFTAGGTLKVPMETARKVAAPLFNWLSDYNQSMENAIRLAAYKAALDKEDAQGNKVFTKQQAASLAKNLTVNFNRKGQIGRQAGAWFAFFNAAVQGTARMAQTMFRFNGKRYELSPLGKKIFWGGIIIGSAQAMALAALGFDEDEPPEFIKERNFIIPTGKDTYLMIPMPLGYNVIPNTGRILTEWTLSGFKETPKRVEALLGSFLDMFNPLGNAGWSAQTFMPTVFDPATAIFENKDWTGKPIAKEDFSSLSPTPGYTRAKETASALSKELAYFLNAATGGTDYKPGKASPTPDQIDYLIGQLTGGVGRELLKVEQTVTSQFTGEELPLYKVPLVGRFAGETTGVAAERNRFYRNLIELNKHENELKGRRQDRVPTQDYLMEYPEARLYGYANQVERNIQKLKKRRDMLIEKDAPKEQVKAVENQMMVQMKRFNDRVRETQQ